MGRHYSLERVCAAAATVKAIVASSWAAAATAQDTGAF